MKCGNRIGEADIKPNKLTFFLCVVINIFIFMVLFSPSYTMVWAVLLVVFDLLFLFINKGRNVIINTTFILWFIFICVGFIGTAYNNINTGEAFQFVSSVSLFLLNYVILLNNNNWCKVFIDIFFAVSLFFVIGTIIQLFDPDIILYINSLHFDNAKMDIAMRMYEDGYYTGFTYQTAINAFIISVFMSIVLLKMVTCKKRKTKLLLLVIYALTYLLIFMTGKRGFIIFNALIFIVIMAKFSKYKIKSLLVIVLFMFMLCFIIFYTDIGTKILSRFVTGNDITTGRVGMNILMWNDFLESPLWGNGTYTTSFFISAYNGHNIYLQVLRENGLIGFIPFICVLMYNLLISFKLIVIVKKDQLYSYILGFSLYMQLIFILWGFTGNPLYDTYPLITYFISLAMVISIMRKFKCGRRFEPLSSISVSRDHKQ